MKKLIKNYDMYLYKVDREQFVSHLHNLPDNITLVYADEEVLTAVSGTKKYWKCNLKKGSECIFALDGQKIVGHIWLKKKGARDIFYRFGKGVAYFSEAYVDDNYRGKGIFPAMISQIILSHPEYNEFYTSIYTHNVSSINGAKKIGFEIVKTLSFVRALKITLNKYRIS